MLETTTAYGLDWLAPTADTGRVVMEMFLSAGYRLWWFLAPFVTRQTSRSGDPLMLTRGDFNTLAMPDGRESPWKMPEVAGHSPRPVGLKHYPYLARFGF